jgi:RNA polymerase sigma factor (sigma-70 family)
LNRIEIDNALCESFIQRGTSGDASACQSLIEYLWPIWLEMARSSKGIQLLPNAEDGIHDVVATLVEKLGQPSGRGLNLYPPWRQRNPDKQFEDWLRIVTQNTIRDYLREKVGARATVNKAEIGVKRLLNEFASAPVLEELGVRPPVTLAQTARELIEFARNRLPPRQLNVLEAWLGGASFEEIATEQQLPAEQARQLLRSSVAVLRRYFASKRPE